MKPKYLECDCGRRLLADVPFESGKVYGLRTPKCKCGAEGAASTCAFKSADDNRAACDLFEALEVNDD